MNLHKYDTCTFQKLSFFWGGGTKYFARKGNKLEKEWRWGG